MSGIDDDELVLYHYRDGLPAARYDAIAAALRGSAELRGRYDRLCGLLAAVDAAEPEDADPGLEARLWTRLQARIDADAAPPVAAQRSASRRPRQRVAWAVAAAASLVLAVGFLGGRLSAPDVAPAPGIAVVPDSTPPAPPRNAIPAAASPLATRALDAYVASHLRTTEGLLLGASHGDDASFDPVDAALAAALVDSNRLYAAAAARAGNARLAGFLQQLEPVLIELANPPTGSGIERSEGLREFIDDADLLFQVRATETQLRSRGQIRS